ncbi:MAG: hypothetical protein AAFQ98_00715 [Bacteroidota bacterium]
MLTFNHTLTIILVLLFLVLTFSTLTSQLTERFLGNWLRKRFLNQEMKLFLGPSIWKDICPAFELWNHTEKQKPVLWHKKLAKWYYRNFQHPKLTAIANDDFANALIAWTQKQKENQAGTPIAKFRGGLSVLLQQPEGDEKHRLGEKIQSLILGIEDFDKLKEVLANWFNDFGEVSKKRYRRWSDLRLTLGFFALVVTIAFDLNLIRVGDYLANNQAQSEALQELIENTTEDSSTLDPTLPNLDNLLATLNDKKWRLPIFRPRELPRIAKDTVFMAVFELDTLAPPGPSEAVSWNKALDEWINQSIQVHKLSLNWDEWMQQESTRVWPIHAEYLINPIKKGETLMNDYFIQALRDSLKQNHFALGRNNKLDTIMIGVKLSKTEENPKQEKYRSAVAYHYPTQWSVPLSNIDSIEDVVSGTWPQIPIDSLQIIWDGRTTLFHLHFNPTRYLSAAEIEKTSHSIINKDGNKITVKASITYLPPEKEKYNYLAWYETKEIVGYIITVLALALGGPFWFRIWNELRGNITRFRQPNRP